LPNVVGWDVEEGLAPTCKHEGIITRSIEVDSHLSVAVVVCQGQRDPHHDQELVVGISSRV